MANYDKHDINIKFIYKNIGSKQSKTLKFVLQKGRNVAQGLVYGFPLYICSKVFIGGNAKKNACAMLVLIKILI